MRRLPSGNQTSGIILAINRQKLELANCLNWFKSNNIIYLSLKTSPDWIVLEQWLKVNQLNGGVLMSVSTYYIDGDDVLRVLNLFFKVSIVILLEYLGTCVLGLEAHHCYSDNRRPYTCFQEVWREGEGHWWQKYIFSVFLFFPQTWVASLLYIE